MPHTAIDTDDLSGEKIRQISREKFDDFRAVFGVPQTSHRDLRYEVVLDLPETTHPVHGGHVAWRNGVDIDPIGAQVPAPGSGSTAIMPALATA